MQAFNRIQNAIINANAAFEAGLVVGSANAHRAYPSSLTCDSKPVPKCSGQMPMSFREKMIKRMQKRLHLTGQEQGPLTTGLQHGTWRNDLRQDQMPAVVWATFVLSPTTSG